MKEIKNIDFSSLNLLIKETIAHSKPRPISDSFEIPSEIFFKFLENNSSLIGNVEREMSEFNITKDFIDSRYKKFISQSMIVIEKSNLYPAAPYIGEIVVVSVSQYHSLCMVGKCLTDGVILCYDLLFDFVPIICRIDCICHFVSHYPSVFTPEFENPPGSSVFACLADCDRMNARVIYGKVISTPSQTNSAYYLVSSEKKRYIKIEARFVTSVFSAHVFQLSDMTKFSSIIGSGELNLNAMGFQIDHQTCIEYLSSNKQFIPGNGWVIENKKDQIALCRKCSILSRVKLMREYLEQTAPPQIEEMPTPYHLQHLIPLSSKPEPILLKLKRPSLKQGEKCIIYLNSQNGSDDEDYSSE